MGMNKEWVIDIFLNDKNWQVGNWQTVIDTLIAIIEAQRQNYPQRFGDVNHFRTKHTEHKIFVLINNYKHKYLYLYFF